MKAPVIDWAGLQAVNNQVVGWIQIPDYARSATLFIQTTDNDHYLHTNAKRRVNRRSDFYGHRTTIKRPLISRLMVTMRNGSMFQYIKGQ